MTFSTAPVDKSKWTLVSDYFRLNLRPQVLRSHLRPRQTVLLRRTDVRPSTRLRAVKKTGTRANKQNCQNIFLLNGKLFFDEKMAIFYNLELFVLSQYIEQTLNDCLLTYN